MARRHIHYEAAFEDYVRSRGWPYVPVDEQRKAIFSGARIKSFDFIVYRPESPAWLVDIKGRKFPYDGKSGKHYWENWVTQEDVDGLLEWGSVFGEGFDPVFIFTYWLTSPSIHEPDTDIHLFRERYYALTWISVDAYAANARRRSPKWGTVSVPTQAFRKLVHPIRQA